LTEPRIGTKPFWSIAALTAAGMSMPKKKSLRTTFASKEKGPTLAGC
jgi:hypothetical protein